MGNCNSGAVGAFLAGAIIGGAVALLFAPRSGAETRGMIRDYVDEEIDMVKKKAASASDRVENEIEGYKRKARRVARRVEDAVENVVDDARDRIEAEMADVRRAVAGRRTPTRTPSAPPSPAKA